MEFFTTRDRLEIADIPFTIPDDKPTRRQALAYYRVVVERYQIPLALYEEVLEVRRRGRASPSSRPRCATARRTAGRGPWRSPPATSAPRLGVPGEDLPWVLTATRSPTPTSARTW